MMNSAFLFRLVSTVTICFATVATPLLVRSLIDGIIPTKDLGVIGWTLAILALTEIFNILVQFQLNNDLDKEETITLSTTRSGLIQKIFERHKLGVDQHKFIDFWSGDLPKYIYQKHKAPWFRLKDGLMILLLSLICINISYLAGLIVLGLFVVVLINTALSHKDQGIIFSKTLNLREKERVFFNYIIEKYDEIKDLNRFENYDKNVKKMLDEMVEGKLAQSHQRSLHQRINSLVRFFMIFGVLSVGSILYAQNELSMGSLWSLIITIYRLNGPLQNYSRWIMSIGSEASLAGRVEKFFTAVSTQGIEKPKYFNKISKVLDDTVNLKGRYLVVFASEYPEEEIKEAVRFWKSRSSKKESIFILSAGQDIVKGSINIRFAFSGDNYDGDLVIVKEKIPSLEGFDSVINI